MPLLAGLIIPIIFLIWFIIKVQSTHKAKIAITIVSLFALSGFFFLWTIGYALIADQSFKPRLGHYLISKFSEPYDIIGRLTLNDKLEILPWNKDNKIIGIYKDGKLYTGRLENGIITPIDAKMLNESKGEVMDLRYVIFGDDRFE